MYVRNCPKCGKEMQYSSKESLRSGNRRNSTCCSSRAKQYKVGQLHSEETKQKISQVNKGKEYNKSLLGKKQSPEHLAKRRAALKGRIPGFGGKSHSSITRQKQRAARIADLDSKFPIGWTSPNYNKTACELFEEINRELGWNGQH